MKPTSHQIHAAIGKIKTDPIGLEAKALIIMAYKTRLPGSRILNLTSDQITIMKSNIIIYAGSKKFKIKKMDPLGKILWDHARSIPPNHYLFKTYRSTSKRIDSKYYYWVKKWFGSILLHVTPRDLMKK